VLEHQYLQLKEQKRQFLIQFKVELQSFQDRISKDPLLSKDSELMLDSEFHQIKDDFVPKPENNEPQNTKSQ
ncbi:MAG TPA: hypothetical protein PLD28_03885, partial [Candidatus Cloacimonas sp.]|nr:hypothetical protein [Candidatus Cloacimonas sp.]